MERTHERNMKNTCSSWKNCIKKKNLNEPDYYNGVVSHPEPDILKCKVKWDLSPAFNKASWCDKILAKLFKSLKEDAIKVLHSLFHKIWKT